SRRLECIRRAVGSRAGAELGHVTFTGVGTTERRGGLELVGRTIADAIAVLVQVTDAGRGAADGTGRLVVEHAAPGAVAGVGIVAHGVAGIAAGGSRRLERVRRAGAEAVTEVGHVALAGVGAAQRRTWLVVIQAIVAAVAGVGVVAHRVARIAASG